MYQLLPQELLSRKIIVRNLTAGGKIYQHGLRLAVNYIDTFITSASYVLMLEIQLALLQAMNFVKIVYRD